jgi:hypothetical protein
MFSRLKWFWLDEATWEKVPYHILEETRQLLRIEMPTPPISPETRIHVAKRIHQAHLDSIQSSERRRHVQQLWYRDEYPYIRQMEKVIQRENQFKALVNDPDTIEYIRLALPAGCSIRRIEVLYSIQKIMVQVDRMRPTDLFIVPHAQLNRVTEFVTSYNASGYEHDMLE